MWTAQERLRWWIILAIALCSAAAVAHTGVGVRNVMDEMAVPGLVFAALAAFGLFYRHVRQTERVALAFIAVVQLAFIAIGLGFATYAARAFDRPLIDAALYAFDQRLGFDWPSLFNALMFTDLPKQVLVAAYNSSYLQVAVLTLALGFAGAAARLERFMLAYAAGGVITVALWSLYPSFGAAAYLHSLGAASGLPDLAKIYSYVPLLAELQADPRADLDAAKMTGIVGAPSFHTVMSLLTVRAVMGLRLWFWPVALWNVAVLASVPVFGGHHLADMLAGAAVAGLAVVIAERVCGRASERPREDLLAAAK
jgi:PAP2 superfamily